ncbi:acetyl-CoA carboxylase biotin carboxylase subunit family protein [Mesorhizobium sp. VK9D]|uniref:ATP-grasp domain-containing protein n=1 Tax=Mesorhizobium australafricanum TaxID=3072311 RepID=UPI002A24472E|nr:acetyl-CoA carboxylase biotin carboxylase subunit family protein [Mesorhizobium sp. VK9D]MDX8455304.1 acetyl-CoA carboxylase biotin carboxylase subunit family protein [Mesorhizobium sp. VK9D]
MLARALILIEGHARGNGPRYVEAARRLGLYPVTLSNDPTKYRYLEAERSEVIRVDTNNIDALISKCNAVRVAHGIAGITGFSGDDESVYATVGKLCGYFDLPGPNPTSVLACYDKSVQRRLLEQAGVPVPAFRVANNPEEIEQLVAELGLPVVLKPAIGIGSIGVRLCRTMEEVANHKTDLLDGNREALSLPKVLVEEFAQGPYYCVNLMGHEIVGVAAAEFSPPPHFVYRDTTVPAALTDYGGKHITEVSRSCLRALDLGWGPTNIELRWTDRGPVVIEVNPRLAGAPDPQLIQLAFGVDLIAEHVKLIIGDKWDLRRTHLHTAASRNLVPNDDGILEWISGVNEAAALPGVAEVQMYVTPNTPIVRKGDFRDLMGRVVVSSPDRAQTETILQCATDLIGWSIKPMPVVSE